MLPIFFHLNVPYGKDMMTIGRKKMMNAQPISSQKTDVNRYEKAHLTGQKSITLSRMINWKKNRLQFKRYMCSCYGEIIFFFYFHVETKYRIYRGHNLL